MTAESSHSEQSEPRREALITAAHLRMGIPGAALVLTIAAGLLMGAAGVILVLAGGALVGVIAIFWASLRTLFGETPLSGADAYALGAPRAEEERKQAVLRALKDLEFERSVGKISDADYKILVAKYREEAKRLLRVLDEEAAPRRAKVEGLVQKRLAKEGLQADSQPAGETAGEEEEAEADQASRDESKEEAETQAVPEKPAHVVCSSCGSINDSDAVFCKKCGARMKAGEEPSEEEVSS